MSSINSSHHAHNKSIADPIEDRLESLAKKDQWQEVAGILQKRAPRWIDDGQGPGLKKWLERIPEELVSKSPWLLFWFGIVLLPSSPRKSSPWFEQSFALFERKYHIIGMFAAWSGAVDAILYTWDDLKGLNAWIDKYETIRKYYAWIPTRAIKARVAASMFAALMYCQPYHRDMEKWVRRAVAASKSGLHPTQRMLINYQLVYYFVWMGEFSKACLITQHVSKEAAFGEAAPMAKITSSLVEAIYTGVADANVDACHQAVARGLKLAEQTNIHIWDGRLLGQGAWGELMQGDTEAAEHYLEHINALLNPERRLEYSFYHNQRGWQALLKQNFPLALEHTREALKLARQVGVIGVQTINHQALCLILLEMGELEQAHRHVIQARDLGRGRKSGLFQFFRHLLLARIWFERGHNSQGLNELRLGMEMGRQRGYRTTPWWHAPSMVQLCTRALEAGIEVEYVQELIRNRNLKPPTPPLAVENWPWPLKITTLGGFSMLINDQPYQPSGKAQHKPIELLEVMISLDGRSVCQETLADILWPDVDGDKAQQAFTITLHRLRKLLYPVEAIQLREKKLSLVESVCWLDIWEVNHLQKKINTAIIQGKKNETEISYLTQRLLSLYQGHFLSDEASASWLLSCRERLRSGMLHQLRRLGRYWEELEEWETARDIYLCALEVDMLMEEYYRRLMICYWKQDRRAEALALYERCRRILRSRLDIEPCTKTQRLHSQILANR